MNVTLQFSIRDTLDNNIYRILLLLTVTLTVYYPVLNGHLLHFDDLDMVQWLSNPYHPPSVKSFFLAGAGSRYYRPLLLTSFLFDHSIWQQEAAGYHLTNYLLHAANAMLLYFILSKLTPIFEFADKLLPLVGSLLFALHPLTCESVAWVSGRTDVLATFFCLAGFLFYQYNRRIGVVTCLLLGLLTKESALSLIPIVLLTDFWVKRHQAESIRQTILSFISWLITMFIPLLMYFRLRTGGISSLDAGANKALSHNINSAMSAGNANYNIETFVAYGVQLLAATTFYMKKLFVPFPLNFAIHRINTQIYLLLSSLIFLPASYITLRKNFSILGWIVMIGAGFAPGLLVATSNLAWMPFAERYLYLACAIWAAAMVFAVDFLLKAFPTWRRMIFILIAAIICLWGYTTLQRTFTWQDDSSLWAAAYKSAPTSGKIMYKYGTILIAQGHKAAGLESIKDAVKTIKDKKWKSYALITLGDEAVAIHDFKKAKERYEEALATHPGYIEHTAIATLFTNLPASDSNSRKKNIHQAVIHYLAAYKIKNDPNFLYQAAKLQTKRNPQTAKELYREIVEKYPGSQEAMFSRQILRHFD